MAWIAMGVIGFAGFAKLLDLPVFVQSLGSWELLPAELVLPASVAIPSLEIAVFAAWVTPRFGRPAVFAGIALLAVFTMVYIAHLVWARQPECGCFGKILLYERRVEGAWWIIARNALLVVMLIPGVFHEGMRDRK